MKNLVSNLILPKGSFIRNKYNKILIAFIVAWVVDLINECADLFLAGAFLNEEAVSAISLVEPVASIVAFLGYLISVGTSVLFSRYSGAGNKDKSSKVVGQGVILSLVSAAILVVGMLIFEEPLFAFYDAGETITNLAREYFMCEIFFAAFCPLYYVIYQLVEVDGDETVGLLACIFSAIVNFVASILLVKSIGIKGLALGTIIGTVAGLAFYCIHFFRKTNSVGFKLYFNIKETLSVFKISSSTAMTLLYVAIVDIVMNKVVIAQFGDEFLPAYAVVNFLLNSFALFAATQEAASGFVGVSYGEKNPDGISRTMKIAIKAALITSIIVIIILEVIAPFIPNWFGVTNPEVIKASIIATRIIAFAGPGVAICYLFSGYFSAIEQIFLGHVISIIYMLIAPLALAIPLGNAFGFTGLSIGFMLTPIVADVITYFVARIKYGKEAMPLLLDKSNEIAYAYDISLNKESITNLCSNVKETLEKHNIPNKVINEVQLILEESYMTILERNPKKEVLSECNILVSNDRLRVITRDNGCIFDITDANAKIESFRSYVLALLMERNEERSNTTTISFNRNSYYWNLKEK